MSASSENILPVRRSDGSIDVELLAGTLEVTVGELTASVGLSGQEAQEAQGRLNELVQILVRVTPWRGNPQDAYDWFCHRPIAGFGHKTASDMVQAGRASAVQAHLDRGFDGGYA